MKKLYFLLLLTATATAQQVTTITGFGGSGYADGPLATAQFSGPWGLCTDPTGNILYVADSFNNKIRKIDLTTNMVSTLAGSTEGYADGSLLTAQFYYPRGICMDSNGNLFVTDENNHRIRKIDLTTNMVTSFAGSTQGYVNGLGTTAKFNDPIGICIDSNNNLFVSEDIGNKIRKITPTGQVTNYAGSGVSGFADGVGTTAMFQGPQALCADAQNNIFVSDTYNSKIRKIEPNRTVTTIAGSTGGYLDGPALQAKFIITQGICIDNNNNLYVNDSNNRIRKINLTTNTVSTIFDGGSSIGDPRGIFFINNILYYTEFGICKIKKITDVLNIESFETNNILIYPIPSKGIVKIESNSIINSILVYDTLGRTQYKSGKAETNNYEISIETKGLYFITIVTESNKKITKKIIID